MSTSDFVHSGDDDDDVVEAPVFSPDAVAEDAVLDAGGSCGGACVGFCKWGRALESTSTNHSFTAEELIKMNSYASAVYLEPDSEVHRAQIGHGSKSVLSSGNWDRWLTMALIGFITGLVGAFVKNAIELLNHVRLHEWMNPETRGVPVALLWSVCIGALFALISASLVICIQPAAAASGVPEIMAFLNGVLVRKVFNVTTGFVKFVSVIFAVGSGLPVGPEGPMIHLGAFIGAGVSQGRSDTLKCGTPCCRRFRNSRAQRDFISAGAASGIASAFGAPVGGLLFAMEEVSSFFTINLCTQIFFCAMCATATTTFITSYVEAFVPRFLSEGAESTVMLGQFNAEASWILQVTKELPLNIFAFIPAIALGVVGGALGALFTFCNVKVARFRRWIIAPRPAFRIAEPVVVVVIFLAMSMLLPYAYHGVFGCTALWSAESDALTSANGLGGVAGGAAHDAGRLRRRRVEDVTTSNETDPDALLEKALEKRSELFAEKHLVPFLCTEEEGYDELASLLYNSGENVVKLLMSRGTHRAFGPAALIILVVTYAPFACWIAGSAVSSGLVVPMLLIGGAIGRLLGIAMAAVIDVDELTAAGGFFEWVDPGAFALIGASAFFGGVSRLTMSLTVIMLEISGDLHFLLLIMTAVMVSKWIADKLTHSLYQCVACRASPISALPVTFAAALPDLSTLVYARIPARPPHHLPPSRTRIRAAPPWPPSTPRSALLEVKSIPFLDADSFNYTDSLDLHPVSRVMAQPPVTLRKSMHVRALATLLHSTTHASFPVVAPDAREGADAGEQEEVATAHTDAKCHLVGVAFREVLFGVLSNELQHARRRALTGAAPEPRAGEDGSVSARDKRAESMCAIDLFQKSESDQTAAQRSSERVAAGTSGCALHCDDALTSCSDSEGVQLGIIPAVVARLVACIRGGGAGDGADDPLAGTADEREGGSAADVGAPTGVWRELFALDPTLTVDISSVIDTSPITVLSTVSIERVYILFRTLGLRMVPVRLARFDCLTAARTAHALWQAFANYSSPPFVSAAQVTDHRNRVRGVVTRKDLLGHHVAHCLDHHAEHAGEHADEHGAANAVAHAATGPIHDVSGQVVESAAGQVQGGGARSSGRASLSDRTRVETVNPVAHVLLSEDGV